MKYHELENGLISDFNFLKVETLNSAYPMSNPKKQYYGPYLSKTIGGPILNSTFDEQGKELVSLEGFTWTCFLDNGELWIYRDDKGISTKKKIYEGLNNVVQIDFELDQNMNPFLSLSMYNAPCKYLAYNKEGIFGITNCPDYIKHGKICLNERSLANIGISDIIMVYLHNNKVCAATQRDRFTKEYVLGDANFTYIYRLLIENNYYICQVR